MRINLSLGLDGRFYAPAMILRQDTGDILTTAFLVDTGAAITFISQTDAEKLRVRIEDLPHSPLAVGGVGGTGRASVLRNVLIGFKCEGNRVIEVTMPEMLVIHNPEVKEKTNRYNKQKFIRKVAAPNLLGVDMMAANDLVLFCDFKKHIGYLEQV